MDTLKRLAKKILEYEARLVLKKYKPKIIAITGSVGKTSTREAIYLVLAKQFFVRKNEKSFTAELGVPLAIIGCSDGVLTPLQLIQNIFFGLKLLMYRNTYPDWLILEIDGDKQGDLSRIGSYIKIDILVMTAIGEVPSHIEYFSSMESFLSEKKSIINAVKKDGVIIYNADDLQTSNLLEDTTLRKISCGTSAKADLRGTDFKILYSSDAKPTSTGMSFEIVSDKKKYQTTILGSVGIHNEYATLLAFAVGVELNIEPSKLIASLNKYKSLPGRMNLINGINNSLIIDDSYNASPLAMHQALEVFGILKCSGKKIAVLGDMMELGKYSAQEHKKLAELIKGVATNVICIGLRTRRISDELLDLGFDELKLLSVDDSIEAGRELQKIISEGDIVLIKGSQIMRMERVVEEVMRHPEDKKELLTRQEPEWLNRD